MLCEDCLFELGQDDYDISHCGRNTRFRCSRCEEIVPARVWDNSNERLVNWMIKKENKDRVEKKYLPISWLNFRNNCKHFVQEKAKISIGRTNRHFNRCFYKLNRQKYKPKTKKASTPDLCNVHECPVFLWLELKEEITNVG